MSIPEACDSWSETYVAYCFLGNVEVSWDCILMPHWERIHSIRSCRAFKIRPSSISTAKRPMDWGR